MEASVLGDLLPRARRREQPAVAFPTSDRAMSYQDFFTNAYKSGNVLRFLGVRSSATVAIEPTLAPEPYLAFLGAAQLGAGATFDPTAEARVRLVPVDREADHEPAAATKLAVYGGPPESPATTHWEQEVWSENPGFPATDVDPDSTVLLADGESHSHRAVLAAADGIIDTLDLDGDSRLAIRVSPSTPAAIVGLVAALAAEATAILVGESDHAVDADAAVVAAESGPPESATLAAREISL